jgi:uncharacterized membrane protein (UPF0127 family)
VTSDDTVLRRLLAAALVLVALGLWAFTLRGAGGPADPELGPPAGSSSVSPPGDPGRVPLPGFSEVAITVQPAGSGSALAWCLLAAMSAQQRARGLMGVTDLKGYGGMVFVYDQDSTNAFYMRNTPTPLSIAWVKADGDVVTITDMAPCADKDGCPLYRADEPYRYAIEAFQGKLDGLGITKDATVTVGGPCAPRGTTTT